ncbi:MAG: monovalent cation/H+ antiporter complex subunit F [Intestinimonas sp.]|nr:monovalent cation/H+ antiporter complex subunit F [Intestinimonas sp.]
MEAVGRYILIGSAIALALLMLVTLIRGVIGPRFTDRIMVVNMINTMVLGITAVLALYMDEDFLIDVALVYALLSFLTVVVLARLVTVRHKCQKGKDPCKKQEQEEAQHD